MSDDAKSDAYMNLWADSGWSICANCQDPMPTKNLFENHDGELICAKCLSKSDIEKLWAEFSTISVKNNQIESSFHQFLAGTLQTDILDWFEKELKYPCRDLDRYLGEKVDKPIIYVQIDEGNLTAIYSDQPGAIIVIVSNNDEDALTDSPVLVSNPYQVEFLGRGKLLEEVKKMEDEESSFNELHPDLGDFETEIAKEDDR